MESANTDAAVTRKLLDECQRHSTALGVPGAMPLAHDQDYGPERYARQLQFLRRLAHASSQVGLRFTWLLVNDGGVRAAVVRCVGREPSAGLENEQTGTLQLSHGSWLVCTRHVCTRHAAAKHDQSLLAGSDRTQGWRRCRKLCVVFAGSLTVRPGPKTNLPAKCWHAICFA